MPEQTYITKAKAQQTAMNYEELRALGIKNIQQKAPATWTDHNLHDPGITILELLSYAITDLGHRADYDMRDILTEDFDKLSPLNDAVFQIPEILPCNPVTINDWRKWLIDKAAVKNAWVRVAHPDAPSILYQPPEEGDTGDRGQLFFGGEDSLDSDSPPEPLSLKGFYEVYLELEEHDELGDLNSSTLYKELELVDEEEVYLFGLEFIFPNWSELSPDWYQKGFVPTQIKVVQLKDELAKFNTCRFRVEVRNEEQKLSPIEVTILVTSGTKHLKDGKTALKKELRKVLSDKSKDGMMAFFQRRVQVTADFIQSIRHDLLAHRNLCEDFLKVDLICYQEISLGGDIIVRQGSDPNEVSAAIYFLIDQFLRPLIRFRNYDQMKALGYAIDQLFSGPLLENGFIHDADFDGPLLESDYLDDKSLRALVRNVGGSNRTDELVIYTSDLIRIIMSLKKDLGIIAVRNFSISSYRDHILQSDKARDCLSLKDAHFCKPKLDLPRTAANFHIKTESLTVIGEDENLPIDLAEVLDRIQQQRQAFGQNLSLEERQRFRAQLQPQSGRSRKIERYHSMQNDFPLNYGISRAGLASGASDGRRAKARQLKAYLLFFEQFMANHQSQLAHLKELFSIDRRVSKTYFSQSLYNVPDAYLLLKDFVDNHVDSINQYNLVSADWTHFKDDLSNNYRQQIQAWMEDPSLYLDRRNRFLNHLMARFGEDFEDYSALRYFVDQSQVEEEMIDCKIAVLESLPFISRARSRSFDHRAVGDDGKAASQVAYEQCGYKQRLSRLLGLKELAVVESSINSSGIEEFRFHFTDVNGVALLRSSRSYSSRQLGLMRLHIRTVRVRAREASAYRMLDISSEEFRFAINNFHSEELARSISFSSEGERSMGMTALQGHLASQSRFQFIEQFLLRPLS
ncbi:MAG: hypothetical protein AAFV25_19735, partial [Bacteroidota bacterium]